MIFFGRAVSECKLNGATFRTEFAKDFGEAHMARRMADAEGGRRHLSSCGINQGGPVYACSQSKDR